MWSMEEAPQRDRDHGGSEHAGEPQEHREPVELADLLGPEVADYEHGRSQPKLGEERDQPEVDRGHAHETVVLGAEQASDDEP